MPSLDHLVNRSDHASAVGLRLERGGRPPHCRTRGDATEPCPRMDRWLHGRFSGKRVLSVAGDERGPNERPANRMTREEAERLRELLRSSEPAELAQPPVLQRIGRAIARAILGPSKRGW
jgi:hypothetical protein